MARLLQSNIVHRFGSSTFPFRLPLSTSRTNETIGQTVEQAIADNNRLDSGINPERIDPVLLAPMKAITAPLAQHFTFDKAIGVKNTKVDFHAEHGPMGPGTTSVKSSYRDDKVCPQTIGQTTKERYAEYFNINKGDDIALAIKRHFIENPELVCSEMLKNLNCCDYIIHVSGSIIKKPPALGTLIGSETSAYLDKCKMNQLEINPSQSLGKLRIDWFHRSFFEGFTWNKSLFTFTKSIETWNESCTVKYNGNSIAEFQIHKGRNAAKFRFRIKALVGIIQSERMASVIMTT